MPPSLLLIDASSTAPDIAAAMMLQMPSAGRCSDPRWAPAGVPRAGDRTAQAEFIGWCRYGTGPILDLLSEL
jgi:hypothetical protein